MILLEGADGFLELEIGNSALVHKDERKLLQLIEILANFEKKPIP